MITWILRSGVISVNACRMVLIAELSSSVFSSKMAPNTMYRSDAATIRPLVEAAATWAGETRQTKSERIAATAYEIGMALLAGQRRMTRNKATTTIGISERSASKSTSQRKIQRSDEIQKVNPNGIDLLVFLEIPISSPFKDPRAYNLIRI